MRLVSRRKEARLERSLIELGRNESEIPPALDPLLGLGRIRGSFKLTLTPLRTLKNDIQSPAAPGSPGSALWHTNNVCSCPENCPIIKTYSLFAADHRRARSFPCEIAV